ncbi:MAG: hypothetical protein M3N49_04025 [Candidatus Eremiobacteraeota bacterium]|nr:hypothetical protein [Candidatus Eremiobacteraeota bacterium]
MYLVIKLAANDMEIKQSLRFDSVTSAEAALAALREGTDEVVTLESDIGYSLTFLRSAFVRSELVSEAPPRRASAALISLSDLIGRLGRPIYDGQNTFGYTIGGPPYTVTLSNEHDRVVVWDCAGSSPNRCMAECFSDSECRYCPCALHRGG